MKSNSLDGRNTMTTAVLPEAPTDDHMGWIETQAWVTFRKICKPTSYEVDDLIGEGLVAWTHARNTYEKGKSATFTTWFNFILWRHLYDIVYDSYKKVGLIGIEDMTLFQDRPDNAEREIAFKDWTDTKFSYLEKQYIAQCLIEKEAEPKDFRIRVRTNLNIAEKIEDALRASIRKIIREF
jgi:hypothetical protein